MAKPKLPAGKATQTPDAGPPQPILKGKPEPEAETKLKIHVFPYTDPQSHHPDDNLVVLKVPKKVPVGKFAKRLKELGLGLAVGHPKILTGYAAHIAVVPRAEAKAVSNQNPGALVKGVAPSYKPKEKWTSAGCVVIDSMSDHDRVYVIEPSNKYGPWSFPKGRVDKGESFKQAAVRETWEETGLRVKVLSGKNAYVGKGEGGYSITHYFLAVKTGGSPHPTKETKRVLLVPWDEAKRLFLRGGNKRDPKIADLARQKLKHYPKS